MSQERNSISSILSCTQYQKPKKQKRISFSRNMVFQEFDEDGTTRTYQEKIDDETSSMLMSLEESECNLFDMTVYDAATMEISYLSPASSPKTPAGFRTLSQSPMATTAIGSPYPSSPVCPKIPDSPMITISNGSPNGTSNGSLLTTPVNGSSKCPASPLPTPFLGTPKISPSPMEGNKSANGSLQAFNTSNDSHNGPSSVNTPNIVTTEASISPLPTPIIGTPKVLVSPCHIKMHTTHDPIEVRTPSMANSLNDSPDGSLSLVTTPIIGSSKDLTSPLFTPIVGTPKVSVSQRSIEMNTSIGGTFEVSVSSLPTPIVGTPKVAVSPSPMQITSSVGSPEIPISSVTLTNDHQNGSSSFSASPIIGTPKVIEKKATQIDTSIGTSEIPITTMASSLCSADSFSFSSENTLEQSRREVFDSTCLSMIGPYTEVTDHCDSILVYAEEKSFLSSTYEEEPSIRAPKSTNYSTTFIASIFNETCAESDLESADDCFDFIENSVISKLPSNLIDFSSIDASLTKFVVDLNDEGATTKFMAGNFFVHLKYSIIDAEKVQVQLEDVMIECTIDNKISQKVYALLSEYSPHLLTIPRDEKFIKLMKKTVSGHFEQFKANYLTKTNSLSVIIKELYKMFYKSEALFVDLFNTCRFYEWKIINADIRNFEIAFETFGMRYTLWLVLSLDLLEYTKTTIKVKFAVHKADLKLYPYYLFHKVMKSVEPGGNDYIARIVKTAKKFVLDWRHNHSKKSIRLSIHPCRRTLGGDQTRNFNYTNI